VVERCFHRPCDCRSNKLCDDLASSIRGTDQRLADAQGSAFVSRAENDAHRRSDCFLFKEWRFRADVFKRPWRDPFVPPARCNVCTVRRRPRSRTLVGSSQTSAATIAWLASVTRQTHTRERSTIVAILRRHRNFSVPVLTPMSSEGGAPATPVHAPRGWCARARKSSPLQECCF